MKKYIVAVLLGVLLLVFHVTLVSQTKTIDIESVRDIIELEGKDIKAIEDGKIIY